MTPVEVAVFWRSSIILFVSFETSSIFNALFELLALFTIDIELILLLLLLFWLYLSTSRSRTDVGMIIEDDFNVSSYDVGTMQ